MICTLALYAIQSSKVLGIKHQCRMGIGEEGSCRVGTILFGIDTIDGLDMDSMITIIISVCSGLIGV